MEHPENSEEYDPNLPLDNRILPLYVASIY